MVDLVYSTVDKPDPIQVVPVVLVVQIVLDAPEQQEKLAK